MRNNEMNVIHPTLFLSEKRAVRNIEKMVIKARDKGVRFRPHFKTHQSAQIGEWFRKFGVKSITTSSVDMAIYFSENGWDDITIAFPVNIRELEAINKLAEKINLNLLVESKETVQFLRKHLKFNAEAWIKIDVGYGRTGVPCSDFNRIISLAEEIENSRNINFRGILTHAGHSYKARSTDEIREVHFDSLSKMKHLQHELEANGFSMVEVSIGDTPTCSVADNFDGVDEIRPGNFVFYDITQLGLGSCSEDEIAIALACPVVAKHKDRNELTIHGGAIHLSKEFMLDSDKNRVFGYISLPEEDGWGRSIENAYVSSLSQEHGIIRMTDNVFNNIRIGDILMILPVHSCLTADLMREFSTIEGNVLKMMPKFCIH